MKQLVQDNRSGDLRLEDVPAPLCKPRGILVRTLASVISSGTERAALEFARADLVTKARGRPDLVRQVVDKARTDGLAATYQSVRERLDAWMPLGYSSAGVVVEVGEGAEGFRVGDLVACAGGGFATHAEIVWVPRLLAARVPDGVDVHDAAFATLASVALHGIHRSGAKPGDAVGVIGLGLLGQLTVQMLRAYGCSVHGADLSEAAIAAARAAGVEAATNAEIPGLVERATRGSGLDVVIVTASSPTSEPVELAVALAREGATICVVGDVNMELSRRDLYEKELDVVVARSYGYGRHDPDYELRGNDIPARHVKGTIQRNLAETLRLMSTGALRPAALAPARVPFAEAVAAYDALVKGTGARVTVLSYGAPSDPAPLARAIARRAPVATTSGALRLSVIGAGNYARAVLLPALRGIPDIDRRAIVAAGGLHAADLSDRHGFASALADPALLVKDADTDAVVIATRHDLHAPLAAELLRAGKHVYVEKPLALTREELRDVAQAARASGTTFAVGFNRRFAPLLQKAKAHFDGATGPLVMTYRVNAGALAGDHWTRDAREGGGRILGEVCHFVDALSATCGARPTRVVASMAPADAREDDHLTALIEFEDGSRGEIAYVASGPRGMSKERLEIIGRGRAAELDNFRKLTLYGPRGRRVMRAWSQDKGHAGALRAFVQAARGEAPAPTSFASAAATTLATLAIAESAKTGAPIVITLTPEFGGDLS